MREKPADFVDEDWLLISEALANWAGPPQSDNTDQQIRAYQLIEAISLEVDMSLDDTAQELESIDHSLLPPTKEKD